MRGCPDLVFAEGTDPASVLGVHVENMARHAVCRLRYEALMDAVRVRQ
jgi:hypothetical protein